MVVVGTLAGSPRVQRGAIVAVTSHGPPRVVVFQFNPDEVSRTVAAAETGDGKDAGRSGFGAPRESVSMTVELDAADPFDGLGLRPLEVGVLPELSALELLLHPGIADVLAATVLAKLGTVSLKPAERPTAILVWGAHRVVPVRISELTITEQAFTPALVPARATVALKAEVLTYDDLTSSDVGYALYLAHVIAKEALGAAAVVGGGGSYTAALA